MNAYELVLTDDDLAVIAAGLGELPFKVVKATFDKISEQVKAQQPPADQPVGGTD